MGVTAEVHISGAWLKVGNLDKESAIRIGHALVQRLDALTGSNHYASFTLARAEAEADQKLAENEGVIFGEMRPANRNCVVSVESDHDGSYRLNADIRNEFEDNPRLDGGKRLQLQFIETIETIDFS
jgi:hypothetical protein